MIGDVSVRTRSVAEVADRPLGVCDLLLLAHSLKDSLGSVKSAVYEKRQQLRHFLNLLFQVFVFTTTVSKLLIRLYFDHKWRQSEVESEDVLFAWNHA